MGCHLLLRSECGSFRYARTPMCGEVGLTLILKVAATNGTSQLLRPASSVSSSSEQDASPSQLVPLPPSSSSSTSTFIAIMTFQSSSTPLTTSSLPTLLPGAPPPAATGENAIIPQTISSNEESAPPYTSQLAGLPASVESSSLTMDSKGTTVTNDEGPRPDITSSLSLAASQASSIGQGSAGSPNSLFVLPFPESAQDSETLPFMTLPSIKPLPGTPNGGLPIIVNPTSVQVSPTTVSNTFSPKSIITLRSPSIPLSPTATIHTTKHHRANLTEA